MRSVAGATLKGPWTQTRKPHYTKNITHPGPKNITLNHPEPKLEKFLTQPQEP